MLYSLTAWFESLVLTFYQYVRDAAWGVLEWAWQGLQILWGYALQYVPQGLSEPARELFNSNGLSTLQSIFDVAAWAFPVYSMLAMAALMFSAIGVIRLGRWLFALVPTLGG